MSEIIDVPPDVQRISEGLRDTGYEFNTAVADIIDNSIAAGATVVDVRMRREFDGAMLVSVADNGCGMDRDGLLNAMKYGSKERANPASLGKFGLGLKTASTAFCRRLVVVSRADGSAAPLCATWDLDFMARSGRWGLQIDAANSSQTALLDQVAPAHSGTVVIWEKVDRLLSDYKKPDGGPAQKALKRLEEMLREHISIVYQRFLDPADNRARNVEIRVNGVAVPSWDPFCVIETKSPVLEEPVKVQLPSGRETSFLVRAFILPRKEEFSNDKNRIAARVSNELQGVYIYRENRLIHGPDWLGMYRQEPHFSLLRVELSFNYELDEAFQVDIKKSRILLNSDLYDWLRNKFLASPRREAETRYRKGMAAVAKGAAALLHAASNHAIQQREGALNTATVTASDASTGKVQLRNNAGTTSTQLRIVVPDQPGQVHVTTAQTLDDGVLWEPVLADGRTGVALNTAHPYYAKAYLPNRDNSPLVQALDFLLWSLAQAEMNNVEDNLKDVFQEFRVEVSRNLKKLVADLPDPPEPESA